MGYRNNIDDLPQKLCEKVFFEGKWGMRVAETQVSVFFGS